MSEMGAPPGSSSGPWPEPWDGLLIIANFNQAQEIDDYLRRVGRHFPSPHVVIVDDGSSDGSDAAGEKMGFRVVRHGRNLGIGAAIRTGLRYAQDHGYRWVLISSSNGKIRPEDFAAVYGPVREAQADYVTGSRFLEKGSSPGITPFRRFMIPVFSLFAAMFLGRRFSDITCGFRAYTLEVVRDPSVNLDQDWLSRYELEYYLHYKAVRAGRYRIIEVPVTIQYSHIAKGRKSKIRPVIDWWSMVRPFVFLSLRIRK